MPEQDPRPTKDERLSLALEGASDGLWDWDLVTGEVYLSPRWKGMLGYRDEEIPNSLETFRSLLHPDDSARAEAAIQSYLSGETERYEVELRMLHKDGSERIILSRGAAIRDSAGGEFVRFVGTHVDLTEGKRLEAALIQSRITILERLLRVGISVRDAIHLITRDQSWSAVFKTETVSTSNVLQPVSIQVPKKVSSIS